MRAVAALATVAALLAGFILLADHRHPGGSDWRADRRRLVRGFNRSAVRRVVITRSGEAPFSLVRQSPGPDPAWRLVPGGVAADAGAIDELLTALDFAETDRSVDLTRAAAGLVPPAVTLDLDAEGSPLSIGLGHLDAAGGGVFVVVGAEPAIRVGPRHLRELADREAAAYRQRRPLPRAAPGAPDARRDPDPLRFGDRAVLDFAHFDARSLRRIVAGATVEIASVDGELWRAVTPPGAVVDGANVARVVAALGNLRAETLAASRPRLPPELTLEIAVTPPGEPAPARHTLEIYAAPKSGCIGHLVGGAIFPLAPAACDELRLPLVARGG